MITISLCMIVKNEENTLEKCLNSVKDAVDEIVIVDTGSTDRTKEIAKQFTDKIYDFTWIDDFAAARNESFRHGTKDFLFWLDADDVLLEEDRNKLIELKKTLPDDVDRVMFYYNYAFDANGKPTLTFRRERLVRNHRGNKWVGYIHEVIDCGGKGYNADIYVTHTRKHGNGDRNLKIFKKHVDAGEKLSVRDQYYYGKELFYHGMYEESLNELLKFLEMPAWSEDQADAINRIADILINQKKYKEARKYLFQSFELHVPRAEALYRIAYSYQMENRVDLAAYWYELIATLKKPNTAGFLFDEYWTWRPYLELCVCYDRLGQHEKAREYNEKAAVYVPDHPSIKHNREYFEKTLGK